MPERRQTSPVWGFDFCFLLWSFYHVLRWCIIISHVIGVHFKGRELMLLRDRVFLRAWCTQNLPAVQNLIFFILKDLLQTQTSVMLVLCAFECTYEKFLQKYVSQSSVNLNKQIHLCIFTWKETIWHLLMCCIGTNTNACKIFAQMALFSFSFLCDIPHRFYHLYNSVTQQQDALQRMLHSDALQPRAQPVFQFLPLIQKKAYM